MSNELRQETLKPSFRKELTDELGNICANCGSEINIEYHHIVPLKLGGTNKFSNFAALCPKCHKAAHRGQHISHYTDKRNSGRKPKITKEDAYKIFDMYARGEIGSRKCKELFGYKHSGSVKSFAYYEDYLRDRGILEIKNNVDIVATNSPERFEDGCYVGRLKFENGMIENIFYRNTGINDVVYQTRKNT